MPKSSPASSAACEMEQLYLQYRTPMYRIAFSILHDEGLAEDAVQQAFLKIFQNFEKIDQKDCNKMRAFIVILIRNTAIDLYRQRGRERVVSFEDLEQPLPDQSQLPEERLIGQLEREQVTACLMELEEKYRDLLILRYYHGYQNKDIAQLLGMSQTQVAVGLYRGKQKLRRRLEGGDAHG